MTFTKDNIPWNKGKKLNKKYKEKLSKSHIGKISGNKGKKQLSTTGEKNSAKRPEVREKLRIANTGKKASLETKIKIGNLHRGEKCTFWKGGISTYQRKLYHNAKRRAIKNGAIGSHTFGEWELLKKQYGYTCPVCGESEPKIILTQDHIIPLSKGSSDYIENIQPLCKSCNSRKGAKYEPVDARNIQ